MVDARVLMGKPVARALNDATFERSHEYEQINKRKPCLAVITVDDPASRSYLKTIKSTARKTGCEVQEISLKPTADMPGMLQIINPLNDDPGIDGILVQMPLPKGINLHDAGLAINNNKDVDGISPYQAGLLFKGAKNALVPPTARAVMEILDFYQIGLSGQEVIIVGRSLVVGKPLGMLMVGRNATLTWCHSRTRSLPMVCKRADVLVGALGKARFLDSNYLRPGATVVDVGINVDEDGKLAGDVDVQNIQSIVAAYTPVPGGVGPVTSACLYANLLDAANAALIPIS
jgi:methylenetetrahydrofolate dehydrogenase (NADP+)/methenyltetrahydrofolate cyclohydrolase